MRKLKQMMTLQSTISPVPGSLSIKKVVEEDISPPTPRDLLHLSDAVLAAIEAVQFTSSEHKVIQLSKLQAFATKVTCTDDIDLAYMKMRHTQKFAGHVLLGYHLQAGNEIKQGCTSDRQPNGDQEILKAIKKFCAINIAVFLMWEYRGIPLGGARFENICSLTLQALHELKPETLEPPKGNLKNRGNPKDGVEGTGVPEAPSKDAPTMVGGTTPPPSRWTPQLHCPHTAKQQQPGCLTLLNTPLMSVLRPAIMFMLLVILFHLVIAVWVLP